MHNAPTKILRAAYLLMKIIAIAQGKGGAGKTTVAINLACEMVAAGESAAIVDLDYSQYSSANLWGKMRGEVPPQVVATQTYWLGSVLERLRGEGVLWVFLDLPGKNDPTSGAGIKASDFVIIPCRAASLDYHGSLTTVVACRSIGRLYAYLLVDVPPHGKRVRARRFETELRSIKQPVCPIVIGHKMDISDSIGEGKSAGEREPGSVSHVEFKMLSTWLRESLHGKTNKHRG